MGDYSENGFVDAADFTKYQDNVGAPEGTLPNDDGIAGPIGPLHLDLWKANFGNPGIGSVRAATVPEPSSVLLVLIALAGVSRKRHGSDNLTV